LPDNFEKLLALTSLALQYAIWQACVMAPN